MNDLVRTNDLDDARWSAVLERRPDPTFVLAVRTTHIYCRSGCPARTPHRRNVAFYDDAPAAARAGYRACKRCAPDDVAPDAERARLVARACALLDAPEPPALAEVAQAIGLSRFHFQRVFRAATGLTPGAYLRARRDERFRAELAGGASVTAAIQQAGYGSPSRAYDGAPLGMTPSAFRAGARGERIAFASADCSLGRVLVATTARGVCAIELGDDDADAEAALARHFPHAERSRDQRALQATLRAAVALVDDPGAAIALDLDVRGTAFQRKVWDALRYRWGVERKRALLARERAD
jgi:AraC family transcriptional regulator of adaptative response/methylated-DNA-[protein]-cysteine methyltransferase